MIQSMYNGASGLRAHQTQMDVIGNNIANINTTGFKASRVTFQEALNQTLSEGTAGSDTVGGTDPVQLGLGVRVGSVITDPSQGSVQFTGRTMDVAIEGRGYLALTDGKSQFFTRDGALTVDSNGQLVSAANGFRVMGWNADPQTGAVSADGNLGPIQLPFGQTAIARQTGKISYGGNLDSNSDAGRAISTTYNVFDSLGKSHELSVSFTKTATPGEWTWRAAIGTSEATGTVAFGPDGKVTAGGAGVANLTLADPDGANAALNLNLDFASMSSLAGSVAASVTPTAQDGLPAGSLTGYSIEADGTIYGKFSNGMTQTVAKLAMADFANPGGLLSVGGNVFSAATNSGLAQIGEPSTGGRGNLSPGYIEMSNVDLSKEFTDMIVAQRGFQANSRIITTSDEMLQDLINLKR